MFVDAPHQCPRILVVSPFLGLSLLVVERFDASPLAVPYWLHQRSDDTARWVQNTSNLMQHPPGRVHQFPRLH